MEKIKNKNSKKKLASMLLDNTAQYGRCSPTGVDAAE